MRVGRDGDGVRDGDGDRDYGYGGAVLLLRVGAGFNAGGCGRAWFGYCGSTF